MVKFWRYKLQAPKSNVCLLDLKRILLKNSMQYFKTEGNRKIDAYSEVYLGKF